MKIDKELAQALKQKAQDSNLSPYELYTEYKIPRTILAKIYNGYYPNITEDTLEKIKKVVVSPIKPLEENSEQKLKRQLEKLLKIFKTRKNLAKQLGIGNSILTKIITCERNSTNKTLVTRVDELYTKLEKNNFSLGEFNIEDYIKKHSYETSKGKKIDTKEISRKDSKKALQENKKHYRKLKEGGVYKITKQAYNTSLTTETITIVIIKEYKRFYLALDKKGIKNTLLKNDLYIDTTTVEKLK